MNIKSIKPLTNKEKAFALHYLGEAHFNAGNAAKLAGYRCRNDVNFRKVGSVNLRKPHIKAFIDDFLADLSISSKEILARLSGIARSSIEDVLADDQLWFDEKKARESGAIDLVKKLKINRAVKERFTETVTDKDGKQRKVETAIVHESVEFELHDKLEALEKLGKYHKLFTNKAEVKQEVNAAEVVFFIPDNGRDEVK